MNYIKKLLRNHASNKKVDLNILNIEREKKKSEYFRILYSAKLSFKSEGQRLFQANKNWGNLLLVGAFQVVLVVKNTPANPGDTRDVGSIPG